MTFGSLFSGIGGFDLGLERAGMELRWQVEIDDYCRRVLAKHWPGVKRYGDIREIAGADIEHVNLICGGFPCQPVSVAGRRKRQLDERWLWPEFARIVRLLRPRWILIENVPGLLAGDWDELADPANDPVWKSGMSDVLGELASSGYDAEWDCIPAAALGAPHLRYRTLIVAYPQSGGAGIVPARSRREGEGTAHVNGQGEVSDTERQGRNVARSIGPSQEAGAGTPAGATRSDQVSTDAAQLGRESRPAASTEARNGEGESSRRESGRIFADPPGAGLQERQNQDLLRELTALERSFADAAELRRKGKSRSASGRRAAQTKPCERDPSEEIYGSGWWATEPRLVRMVHGIPYRVDRIRGLGNAVIPQVAEYVGRRILEVDRILTESTASQRGLGPSEGVGVQQQKEV